MAISKRVVSIVLSLALLISMMPITDNQFYSYAEGEDLPQTESIIVDKTSIMLVGTTWVWKRPKLGSNRYADYYEVELYEGTTVESGTLVTDASGVFSADEIIPMISAWDKAAGYAAWNIENKLVDENYYFISIRAAAETGDTLGDAIYSEPCQYLRNGLKEPTNLEWNTENSTQAQWKNNATNPENTVSIVTLYKRLSASETKEVIKYTVKHGKETCDFSDVMENSFTYYFTVQFHSDASGDNQAKDSVVVTSEDNNYNLQVLDAPELEYIEGYGFKWKKVTKASGYTLSVYDGDEATSVKDISLNTSDTSIKVTDSRLTDVLVDGITYRVEIIALGDTYTSTNSAASKVEFQYDKPIFYDGVSVGALQISDVTCDKIVATLKKLDESATGEAAYSDSTKTLTLKGFSYKGVGGSTRNRDAVISLQDNSTIKLSGTNSITCTATDGAGVVGSVKLTGSGNLTVTAKYCGFTSSVDIAGPTIVINADKYGFGSTNGTLTMSSGDLTVTTAEVSGRAVHPNMKADINQSLAYTAGLSSSENRVRELPAKNGTFETYSYMHISSASSLAAAVVTLSKASFVYNDSAQVPEVTVKLNGTKLNEDKDYTLSYHSNSVCTTEIKQSDMEDVGTYYIKISGKGKYAGYIIKPFAITKRNPKVTNGSTYTYNGQMRTGNIVFKGALGKVLLNAKTDGTLPGVYKVKYEGNNNYNSATGSWKIVVKTTNITKLTKGKKSFTVKVKKQGENYVSGYQVRYSRRSKMTKSTVQTIGSKYSTVSKKIKNLKAKTKYYVQVRTYKDIDGVRYYSSWSSKKSVKTK